MKSVFVVSDNIMSSLGFTTAENRASILASKTGIALSNDPSIYPDPFQAARFDYAKLHSLISRYGLTEYNLTEATAILSILFTIQGTDIDLQGAEDLLILSTTKGHIAGLSGNIPPEKETYPAYTADRIAAYFRMKNRALVISNACVSGVTALITACRFLQTGRYENIIVTGIDFVTAFTVSGFQSFKSISPHPCRPYDKARDGLSIGEGAGSILLTNKRERLAGKKELRLLGGATTNDANHISGPSRTGNGLSLSIENALKFTGIDRRDIDFINLHGTATVYNDEMESKALKLSGLSNVPVNSLKAYFGHTLGASGLIETIVCLESLRNQMCYATLGFEMPGTSEPLNVISGHRKTELHTFIKTASGFGGFNSALVVTDKPDSNPACLPFTGSSPAISYAPVVYTVGANQIRRNETPVFETGKDLAFHDFIKSAYKNLNIDYPKFYKMDDLCKLAFITFEYLLKDIPDFDKRDKEKIALVCCNSVSSLDSDIKHRQSIAGKDPYFPSPSVFVYTLPNIMLGEIAIRHKIQGETICFVSEENNTAGLKNYIRTLFETTDTELVVFGKVDYLTGEYEAEMSFVQPLKCR